VAADYAPLTALQAGAAERQAFIRPLEVSKLMNGLGAKPKPEELERVVHVLERLGFDDVESLSFPAGIKLLCKLS